MYIVGSLIYKMNTIKVLIAGLILLLFSACHIFIKRCPIKSCAIRTIHIHKGVQFRGSPWYKNQNPKTGEGFPNIQNEK